VCEKREDKFPIFMEWLKNNKVDVGCVDIHCFPGLGYGLQATKDLKVNKLIISISVGSQDKIVLNLNSMHLYICTIS
jgi:hypothetical protein